MTASRNIVWWLNLCALFSVVNRSQSTSLPVRRDFGYLTNQNIQNTNSPQQKVFKSTSLFFHPYSTDDTCSKSKLHSFHSLENFSNCCCFATFTLSHTIQVLLDPVLPQHHPLQVSQTAGNNSWVTLRLAQSSSQQQMSYQNQFSIFTHSHSRFHLRRGRTEYFRTVHRSAENCYWQTNSLTWHLSFLRQKSFSSSCT